MGNLIEDKSFKFAVRIINLNRHLRYGKKEYVMSKQMLRAGTSIGANVAEAQRAQSRPDFISKLNISLKETCETKYWLRLLYATEFLTEHEFNSIFHDCVELEKILVSILNSSKK